MFSLRDIEPDDYMGLYPCGNDEEARKFFDPLAFKSLDALKDYFKDFFLPLKKETIIPPQIIEKDNKEIILKTSKKAYELDLSNSVYYNNIIKIKENQKKLNKLLSDKNLFNFIKNLTNLKEENNEF